MKFYLILSLLMPCFVLKAEPWDREGGGKYRYSETISPILDRQAQIAYGILSGLTQRQFSVIASKYTSKYINKEEFANIVLNVKHRPDLRDDEINRYGYPEELTLTYDKKTRTIIALKGFFEYYENNSEDYRRMHIDLIHEASHLYGIGTTPETNYLSAEFAKEISISSNFCGLDGTLEQRIKACKSLSHIYNRHELFDVIQTGEVPLASIPFSMELVMNEFKVINSKESLGFYITEIAKVLSPSRSMVKKIQLSKSSLRSACAKLGYNWKLPTVDQIQLISSRLNKFHTEFFAKQNNDFVFVKNGQSTKFGEGKEGLAHLICVSNDFKVRAW